MTASNDEGLKPADKIARATYIPYEHGGGRLFYLAPGSGDRELIADFYREDTRDYILEAIGKIRRAPPKPADSESETITDDRLDELIVMAETMHEMWRDESSRTAVVGWRELKRLRALLRQAAGRE